MNFLSSSTWQAPFNLSKSQLYGISVGSIPTSLPDRKKFSSSEPHLYLYISSLLICTVVASASLIDYEHLEGSNYIFLGSLMTPSSVPGMYYPDWKLFIEWVNESHDCNIKSFKVLGNFFQNTLSQCFTYLLFLLSVCLIPHNLLHNTFCSHHFSKWLNPKISNSLLTTGYSVTSFPQVCLAFK